MNKKQYKNSILRKKRYLEHQTSLANMIVEVYTLQFHSLT